MQRVDPFVVVLAWRHWDNRYHVCEPLCCLRVGGPHGPTAVPTDGYAAVSSLAQQLQPSPEVRSRIIDGLEGVAGERTSPDTVCDMVVAPAVRCQKGNALLRHAPAQLKVKAAAEVAAIAVKEQYGIHRIGSTRVGRGEIRAGQAQSPQVS